MQKHGQVLQLDDESGFIGLHCDEDLLSNLPSALEKGGGEDGVVGSASASSVRGRYRDSSSNSGGAGRVFLGGLR